MPFPRRRTEGIREFPFSAAAPGDRREAMGIWKKRQKEVKVEQEESGKLLSLKLSKKSGEPILGVAIPKSDDRAHKLREQARELREMARKLEHMAEETEIKDRGGRAIRFFRKVLRKGA